MRLIVICAVAAMLAGCATTQPEKQRAIELGMPVFAQLQGEEPQMQIRTNLRVFLDDQGYLRAFAIEKKDKQDAAEER